MFNEELKQILVKKEITTKDKIIFRVILDILNAIFTDEHHVSILKVGYKIDEHQQIWFPNIVLDRKKELAIKNGYAIYLSEDWNYIYQYNDSKNIETRKKLGAKLLNDKIEFVTFIKLFEKSQGIGYHFAGIFIFAGFSNDSCKTMIYKKISDSYQLSK